MGGKVMVNIATSLEISEVSKNKCGKQNHLQRFKRVIRKNCRAKQSK